MSMIGVRTVIPVSNNVFLFPIGDALQQKREQVYFEIWTVEVGIRIKMELTCRF